jgi:hypothetical protein
MAAHLAVGAGVAARRDWLSKEQKAALEAVVEHIGQSGKGISACDEVSRRHSKQELMAVHPN